MAQQCEGMAWRSNAKAEHCMATRGKAQRREGIAWQGRVQQSKGEARLGVAKAKQQNKKGEVKHEKITRNSDIY